MKRCTACFLLADAEAIKNCSLTRCPKQTSTRLPSFGTEEIRQRGGKRKLKQLRNRDPELKRAADFRYYAAHKALVLQKNRDRRKRKLEQYRASDRKRKHAKPPTPQQRIGLRKAQSKYARCAAGRERRAQQQRLRRQLQRAAAATHPSCCHQPSGTPSSD